MTYDLLNDELEWEIVKEIDKLGSVMNAAREQLAPHLMCRYVLSLAALFNSYYSKVNIKLSEEPVKAMRLQLLVQLQNTLRAAMNIVGLQEVERM